MTGHVKIYEQDLPPLLAEIRDLIGIAATLLLVEHYGGAALMVPARYADDHPLARLIGHKAAATLMQRYAGTPLYIAKLDRALRVLRNIEISHRYESGTPVRALAREYQLSERQVWTVLKSPETLREPVVSPQQGLFD